MKRENRLAELRDLAAQTARLRLEVVEQLGPLLLDLAARVAGVIGRASCRERVSLNV